MKKYCLFFAALIACCEFSAGQSVLPDSNWLRKASQNSLQIYAATIGPNDPVFNGREFITYGQKITGSPFYLSEDLQTGMLEYNSYEYTNISFAYDLMIDRIVIKPYEGSHHIILPVEKTGRFSVQGHDFFRPEQDSLHTGLSDTGFYEILYPGKSKLVSKRSKAIQYHPGETTEYVYDSFSRYFAFDGRSFREWKGKNDLFRFFGKSDKALKQLLKENTALYKNNREKMFADAAALYDQLAR